MSQLQHPARTRPAPRPAERPARTVAEAQFIRELERRHAQEETDRVLYARWKARQPAVQAQVARERTILAWCLLAVALASVGVLAAVAYVLVTIGLPLLAALAAAVLLAGLTGGGGSCCVFACIVH